MSRVRHPGLHDAKGHELPHRLVDVAGVDTYVVDAGDGPPLVLIHGYGDTADGWRRAVPQLVKDHRIIALDVPPFGRSARIKQDKLLDFYSDWVPHFLDVMDVGSATVIGHSLGGAIALRLAAENPDRVERLGLVAPAGLGSAPPWWWHAITARPIWQGALSIPSPLTGPIAKRAIRTFLEWRLFDNPRALRDEIGHFVNMHGSAGDLKLLLSAGHACIDSYTGKLLERSAELEIPIWMLWGRKDGLVPSLHARAFERRHPDAVVHILDGCGHYPQIELPQRFNHLLRNWLDETAAQPLASSSSRRTRSA
jgi:pimeloyl-ACP methyl ester carboxylesterase